MRWQKTTVLSLALLCSGCASHKRPVHGEVVIPNSCIEKLEPTEKTYCHGPDGQHIKCDGVTLTRQAGCERYEVKKGASARGRK